jgi:excinuclease ABC subunit A
VQELLDTRTSLTGRTCPAGAEIALPASGAADQGPRVTVHNAVEHNLRNVTVPFPLGQLDRGHRGVRLGQVDAGQRHPVHRAGQAIYNAREVPGPPPLASPGRRDRQDHPRRPVADRRTPRSNPATYTGVFDHVRGCSPRPRRPRSAGYQPGRFSFNVKGGRCENCTGDGTIKIEMNFLPDVYVPCEVCHGARYNRETLEVHYKGKSIAEVLDMPIEEAVDFFAALPRSPGTCRPWSRSGLGLRPARASRPRRCPAARRSGSSWPASCRSARPGAPCTCSTSRPPGLHFEDIRKLLGVLGRLVDAGNTVWSSSTTWTSSRPPTGSSTWAPRAAPRAAR